ncbi:MAG: hypothetical protein K2K75_01130 [Muribaculaceae bacterium]|nr:hypothetical protein [Muribaculaceae bacterium]
MDHKTIGIIFFLPYWDVKNPTLEDQTGFIISEMSLSFLLRSRLSSATSTQPSRV